jgi:tetratricopeptide (TPR) repeat protein
LVDDAIESLRQAIDAGLSRTAAFCDLGALYSERGHYDKAIEAFGYSMSDKEYTLGSHYGLGLTYHAAGNVDRALEHFIEVARMVDLENASPGQASQLAVAYQRLTDSYIAKGDTEKASVFAHTLFQFFSDRDWEEESRQARRAMDSVSENNDAMALAEYLETPESEITVTTLALTAEYMERNMLMTAMEECYRAIQKAPASLRLYTCLADILMVQGRTRQAVTLLLTIADTYQVRGEIQNATDIHQEILHRAPMDVQARARLIELLVGEDEIEQALEHYLVLADTYYQTAEVERALTVYGEALGLVSRSPNQRAWETDILYHMGDIFEQRVEWARAIAAYESIMAIAPRDERALLGLTCLYFKQGQREIALRALNTLLDVHRTAGRTQTLLEVLQDMTQAFPEECELHVRLASACVDCGLTRQAIDEYAAVGKMQLEAGQRAEAARTIQTIVDLGPEEVDEYRHLLGRIRSGGS